jgi:hypothetical protein
MSPSACWFVKYCCREIHAAIAERVNIKAILLKTETVTADGDRIRFLPTLWITLIYAARDDLCVSVTNGNADFVSYGTIRRGVVAYLDRFIADPARKGGGKHGWGWG